MAVRIFGDGYVSIAACPTPRVKPPAIGAVMMAPSAHSAAVIGRKTCGNADNRWQRVHYEVKQRPA